jgi:hypothetical protein
MPEDDPAPQPAGQVETGDREADKPEPPCGAGEPGAVERRTGRRGCVRDHRNGGGIVHFVSIDRAGNRIGAGPVDALRSSVIGRDECSSRSARAFFSAIPGWVFSPRPGGTICRSIALFKNSVTSYRCRRCGTARKAHPFGMALKRFPEEHVSSRDGSAGAETNGPQCGPYKINRSTA